MRVLALLFIIIFTVSSCSYLLGPPKISKPSTVYKKTKIINVGPQSPDTKRSEQLPENYREKEKLPDSFVLDTSKPASFEDYKQWRKENDRGGQIYAEFKQWEAALKEQQLKQQKNAK